MPRKITAKEKINGMRYCTFCKPKKIDALWRNIYLSTKQKISFACDKHKYLLIDGQKHEPTVRKSIGEEHFTEADYQTWLRLY